MPVEVLVRRFDSVFPADVVGPSLSLSSAEVRPWYEAALESVWSTREMWCSALIRDGLGSWTREDVSDIMGIGEIKI